jgi:hypothetical protein
MRKIFSLLALALAVIVSTLALTGTANASTSGAPTMHASNVAKGKRIKPVINAHGSKIIAKSSTLWKGKHRVRDWSPKPGLYKVKTVLRYKTLTSTYKDEWVPDEYCYTDGGYDDYVYNEETGEYEWIWVEGTETCEDYGYWDTTTSSKWNKTKRVVRYDYVRVANDETPGCVSRAEFRAVKDGMTQSKVHGIFGTRGWVETSGSAGTQRNYNTCSGDPDWSYVEVDFSPRVWFKWEYISY